MPTPAAPPRSARRGHRTARDAADGDARREPVARCRRRGPGGPLNPAALVLGGHWSGYWYNGQIYGAEIARGLDVLDMVPTDDLTANEIAAANTVQLDEHNAMSMRRIEWAPSFEVVRAYRDQAERAGLKPQHLDRVDRALERAERFRDGPQHRAAVANLQAVAEQLQRDAPALSAALEDLAGSL